MYHDKTAAQLSELTESEKWLVIYTEIGLLMLAIPSEASLAQQSKDLVTSSYSKTFFQSYTCLWR